MNFISLCASAFVDSIRVIIIIAVVLVGESSFFLLILFVHFTRREGFPISKPSFCSLPLVEFVGSSDTLELPEVMMVEGLGVSASQALGNKGVVESLSVIELLIPEGKAESHTHEEAAGHTHVVRVEVLVSSTGYIVTIGTNGTESSHDHGGSANKDGVHVVGIPEGHVEVMRAQLMTSLTDS